MNANYGYQLYPGRAGPRRAPRSRRATPDAAAGRRLHDAGAGARHARAAVAGSWSSSRAARLAPRDYDRTDSRRHRMKFLLLHYADESAEWSAEETQEDQALLAA